MLGPGNARTRGLVLTLTYRLSEGAISYNLLTMAANPISGSLWTLWLYDVCEEIDLDALREGKDAIRREIEEKVAQALSKQLCSR